MKIQVNEDAKGTDIFPLLLKCKIHEFIVLKTDIEDDNPTVFSGVVLHSECEHTKIGEYSKDWDMDVFELFYGNIVLSND